MPYHFHLQLCYYSDSALISSLAYFLHLPSNSLLFIFFCLFHSRYFIHSSFYSLNYLLGHCREQVLPLCNNFMLIYHVHLIKELYTQLVVVCSNLVTSSVLVLYPFTLCPSCKPTFYKASIVIVLLIHFFIHYFHPNTFSIINGLISLHSIHSHFRFSSPFNQVHWEPVLALQKCVWTGDLENTNFGISAIYWENFILRCGAIYFVKSKCPRHLLATFSTKAFD
jgi:hypothetical protein